MMDELKWVSPGLCPGCGICAEDYGLEIQDFNRQIKDGDLYDEGEFGWYACEDCGSPLGGMRYAAHGYDEDELVHFEICADCLEAMA